MASTARITTKAGDAVTITMRRTIKGGSSVYVVKIAGGPYDGETHERRSIKAAYDLYLEKVKTYRTGLELCDLCDGSGVAEHFKDVWTNDGHDTEHWSEPCYHCDESGCVEDLNLVP